MSVMEDLRTRLRREVFEPFVVVTCDGQRVEVLSAEDAWVSPGSGLVYVRRSPVGFHTFSDGDLSSVEGWEPPSRRHAG